MSVDIMSAVWLNGPKQRSERLLLLAVADHADKYTGIAWPSTTTLAEKASMTTRNVSRALESLKIAGWLEILPRTHERGGHTYKLNLPKLNYFGPSTSQDKLSGHRKPSVDKMSSHREPSPGKMSSQYAGVDQTISPVHQTLTTVDQTNQTSPPDILNTPLIGTIKNRQNRQELSTEFVLPEWLPIEQWTQFIEMRKTQRKTPAEYAIKLLIRKLEQYRRKGMDPGEVLDQSTASSWTDVYPLKGNAHASVPVGKADNNLVVLAESLDRGQRQDRIGSHGLLQAGADGQDDAGNVHAGVDAGRGHASSSGGSGDHR